MAEIENTEKSDTPKSDTQRKADEMKASFKGAEDTPEMKHVDRYGEFVEESDSRAAFQVNPETNEGKALIERLKKTPKPKDAKVVESGEESQAVELSEPTPPDSEAKVITSNAAQTAKEIAKK